MKNEFLRHTLSTIKYRFDKSVKESQEHFGDFSLGHGSRSPKEIINHMYEVIYSTRVFIEQETLPKKLLEKLTFDQEVDRFNSELTHIDQVLDRTELDMNYSKKLLQGPFSDLLTHVGQIAMLQRLNDNAIEGEDFSRSEIETGLR